MPKLWQTASSDPSHSCSNRPTKGRDNVAPLAEWNPKTRLLGIPLSTKWQANTLVNITALQIETKNKSETSNKKKNRSTENPIWTFKEPANMGTLKMEMEMEADINHDDDPEDNKHGKENEWRNCKKGETNPD